MPHLIEWLGNQPQPVIPQIPDTAGATAPVAPSAEAQTWLVDQVDLNFGPGVLTLSFVSAAAARCRLELTPLALHQWLEILLRQYRQAEWPETVWEQFVKSFPQGAAPAVSLTLH